MLPSCRLRRPTSYGTQTHREKRSSNFPYATDIVRKLNEAPLQLLAHEVASQAQPPSDLKDRLLPVGFTTIFDYLFLLREACQALAPAGPAGLVLLAAAVSDFYVPEAEMATEKIQSRAHDGLTVQLRNVPKMLGAVREWAPKAFVLSFKLETNPNILLAKAAGALKKYKVDAVCSNVLHTIRDWVTIVEPDPVVGTGDDGDPGSDTLDKLLTEN
ncbi:PPCS [Symbiodinium natans]|uniref:PPCS protein n=1 Tax=Symbiodinium natans TaxID=878477 RepID=A0A812N3D8_9DINO|nr:PPCS [Symbiodinium natans]